MAKLVWRVKLVTELPAGETTEVEVSRIERDERVNLSDLGLHLAEAKQLTSALQSAIVPAQVTIGGELAAPVRLAAVDWPARDTIARHSVPCSATCQSEFGAYSPVPAKMET